MTRQSTQRGFPVHMVAVAVLFAWSTVVSGCQSKASGNSSPSGQLTVGDLPAGTVVGPLTCGSAGEVVRGIDSSGALQCSADLGVTGSGTPGHLAAFTAAGAIGDASITVGGGVMTLPTAAGSIAGAGPGSGLNADLLDGHHETAFARNPGNVLVVGKGPDADYATISGALASIASPSPTNTWLIKVGPGTYNERVTMKPYVDIEGSGIDITVISTHGGASVAAAATVTGAAATLRNLSIENDGTGRTYSAGLYITSGSKTTLDSVSINAIGGATGQYVYGVYVDSGYLWTYNSSVQAMNGTSQSWAVFANSGTRTYLYDTSTYGYGTAGTAYGLNFAGTVGFVEGSSLDGDGGSSTNAAGLDISGGTLEVSGGQVGGFDGAQQLGVTGTGGDVRLRGVQVYGQTHTVSITGGTTYVTGSSLEGGAVSVGGGTLKCVGVSNTSGDPLGATCT